MGFLDRAEQAQKKHDAVQGQRNAAGQSGGGGGGGPAVEYDQHGRPIRQDAPADGGS